MFPRGGIFFLVLTPGRNLLLPLASDLAMLAGMGWVRCPAYECLVLPSLHCSTSASAALQIVLGLMAVRRLVQPSREA